MMKKTYFYRGLFYLGGLLFAGKIIGIGIGTVIAVIGVGRVIAVFNHFLKKKMAVLAGIE